MIANYSGNARNRYGLTADDYVQDLLLELGKDAIESGKAPLDYRTIIDGKIYNTKTAMNLATATASPDAKDYKWYLERLFRNRGGAFFLIGEGMGGTPWGHWCHLHNEAYWGHGILPLTEAQVRLWLELRKLITEYEEIFGLPEEASGHL